MSVLATSRKPSATPQTGRDARLAARAGTFKGQTAGVAPGYVQGNLAILPANLAGDFLRFCQLNPKPCPLLAASAPGDFRLPTLADDLDIRTDLPRYRVFRNGKLVDEPTDIRAQWRGDLVAFVAKRGWGHTAVELELETYKVAHEPKFLSENIVLYSLEKKPKYIFLFPRRQPRARPIDRCARCARRPIPWADGRIDAADEARGCDPRHPDHHALPGGARGAGAYRQAGADRHRRPDEARLRRPGAGQRR